MQFCDCFGKPLQNEYSSYTCQLFSQQKKTQRFALITKKEFVDSVANTAETFKATKKKRYQVKNNVLQ